MWVHPKLHGYTFIYPHRVKSERELDESARNITGIFLYTHSSEFRLISIISRVYFYIPATTGEYPHNITGILLYTRNYMGVPPQYHGYTFMYPQTDVGTS